MTSTSLVPMHEVREALLTGRVPVVSDDADLAHIFIERILSAKTAEEILSASEPTPVQQVTCELLQITGASFNPSTIKDGGTAVYVVVEARNIEGERLWVLTGARAVVAQMFQLLEENLFPQWGAFREVGKQKDNRSRPVYFIKADPPAEVTILPPKKQGKAA